jgi:hypothetical protein
MKTVKEIGEITELKFYLKGFDLGLIVSKPYGDSSKYDFITDWNGVLKRVQIKSTSTLDKGNRTDRYRIMSASGGRTKNSYSSKDIDLIIAYVIPLDVWYIIPVNVVSHCKTLALFPHKQSIGKYEIYKDRWDLLK